MILIKQFHNQGMESRCKKSPLDSAAYDKVSNASLDSCSEGEICDSDFSPVREPIERKYDANRPFADSPVPSGVPKKLPKSYKTISSTDHYTSGLPFVSLPYNSMRSSLYSSISPKRSINYPASNVSYSRSISKSPQRRRSRRKSRSSSMRRRSRSISRSPPRRRRSRSRRRHKHRRSRERRHKRSRSGSQHRYKNGSRHKSRSPVKKPKKSPRKVQYHDLDACRLSRSPVLYNSPTKKPKTAHSSNEVSPLKPKDLSCALNRGIDLRLKSIPSFASQMSGSQLSETDSKLTEAELNKKMESFIKHLSRNQRPSPFPQYINLTNDSPETKLPEVCKSRLDNNVRKQIPYKSVDSFKLLHKVGRGTYGDVYKAVEKTTGELKALKFVQTTGSEDGFPLTSIREIKLLRQLRHKNIIFLKEIVYDENSARTCLVFEYMEHDLKGLLRSGQVEFNESHIAYIIRQILEALNHCHMHCIIHRDIKCANILVNNRCDVKLADFGMARIFNFDPKQRAYTVGVVSLWYRSPEIVLASSDYSSAVDIWSTGCILGELFTRKPVFEASSEAELLEKIAFLCGTLIASVWPGIVNLPGYSNYRPSVFHRRKLKTEFSFLPPKALDLLDSMLQLDPEKRSSASQALKSEWLSSFDPKSMQLPRLPVTSDCHEYKEANLSSNDSKVAQKMSSHYSQYKSSELPVASNKLTGKNTDIDQKIRELNKVLDMADDNNIDKFIQVVREEAKLLDKSTSAVILSVLDNHLDKRRKSESNSLNQRNAQLEAPSNSIFADIDWQSSLLHDENSSALNQPDLSNRPSLFETFNTPSGDYDTNEHSSALESHCNYGISNDIQSYTSYTILTDADIEAMEAQIQRP